MAFANAPTDTRPRSLAYRLTVWYALSSFTLVLLATAFLYWVLARNLDRENDRLLADLVLPVVNLLHDQPSDRDAVRRQVALGRLSRNEPHLYLRVLDEQQQPIAETPSIGLVFPRSEFPTPQEYNRDTAQGRTVQTAAEQWFRIAAYRLPPAPQQSGYTIQAALDRTHEEELLADYRRKLWLVLGAALLICAVGGYQLARRGVRPVRDIAEAAGRIRSSTLDKRIELRGLPDELRTLAETFNAMLGRLESSFTRLNDFAADLAHELRTPINNLRGEAEVALSKARTASEYQELLGSALEEYQRLTRLIDDLLFLARADHPVQQIERETVHVADELERLREFYEAAATDSGVRLTIDCDEKIAAPINRTMFQRAVGNLLSNAVRHTQAHGTIAVSAREQDGALQIEVADTGVGIDAVHLPRLFDRFYRVNAARHQGHSSNVGLGLAIVKSIAELHGGSVRIESEVGVGTKVIISFLNTAPNERHISMTKL
jgi:two-component system heavy metal sensor histidine kinase CusS